MAIGAEPSQQTTLEKINKQARVTNIFDAVADELLHTADLEGIGS